LWVKHLLDNFDIPILFGNNQVAFFAALRIASSLLTILALHFVEKRMNSGSPLTIGRAMLIVTGLISASMIGFALSKFLILTLALYLVIDVLRDIRDPLNSAWVNQKLDPQTRATVHSMSSQVDAIGQVGGGPLVALVAGIYSVTAAILTSGLLLLPALPLINRANTQSIAMDEEQSETVIISE
jgi:MFS transporter, DHA3 family, tetracycline resistance protein